MAKKTRRAKGKKPPVRLSPAQMVLPEVEEAAREVPVAVKKQAAQPAADLGEEYRYVVADLKRIGIIAAAMLAALVILALLLT
jgi:hypothetical protein